MEPPLTFVAGFFCR